MQPDTGTSRHGLTPKQAFPAGAAQKDIAVVEPHWIVRQLYELELQEEGYNTIALAGHVELFSLLADRHVHLVISGDEEQEQPERKRLITLALTQKIPLILNTGYPFSWFSVPDIDSIAVVFKSANMEKLKNKIRHMLARSNRRSAGSASAAA